MRLWKIIAEDNLFFRIQRKSSTEVKPIVKALIPNLTWNEEAKAVVAVDKKGVKQEIQGLTEDDVRYLQKRLKATVRF